jgi:hypothetical protein
MKKETTNLRLRVDDALLARLEKAAEKAARTLTGEMIHRLSESFRRDDQMALVEALSDRITVKVTEVLKGKVVTAADFAAKADKS